MEQNTNPSGLCKKGCGFYGNDSYEGMCSKCFKENVKRQQQTQPTASAGRSSPGNGTCGSATNVQQTTTTPITAAAAVVPTITAKAALVQQTTSAPVDIPKPSSNNTTTTATTTTTTDKCPPVTPTKTKLTTDTSSACLTPTSVDSTLDEPEASSSPSSVTDSPLEDGSPGKLKKRNRCYSCKKKVGLTGFECRCGGLYCGLHRYSDKHNCTFDYKSDGREKLAKANPVVVGEKVKKI